MISMNEDSISSGRDTIEIVTDMSSPDISSVLASDPVRDDSYDDSHEKHLKTYA
jgi:hypothetical protein